MTRSWFKRIIPCLPNKQLSTRSLGNEELPNSRNSDSTDQETTAKSVTQINKENSEIEILSEILHQNSIVKSNTIEEVIGKENTATYERNPDSNQNDSNSDSLSDFSKAKITHINVRSSYPIENKKENPPRNILVFKTILVNGEPKTTRYRSVQSNVLSKKEMFSRGEEELNLIEILKDAEIKIVFSYEVLEHLAKSFKNNSDKAVLIGDQTMSKDLLVCTLFPKQFSLTDEIETQIETFGLNDDVASQTSDTVTMEDSTITPSIGNNTIDISSVQRNTSARAKGFQTSMSKSSPHMQQQNKGCSSSSGGNDSSNSNNGCEIPQMKKVSWEENVEVRFINHSSRSADEILQEVQPLIDHEEYWKECTCEGDRRRREKWLKIRADEERCLTDGDGDFHFYFANRNHHNFDYD